MEQQFCTVCGAKLNEGIRFCENCGTPTKALPATAITSLSGTLIQTPGADPVSPPSLIGGTGKFPIKIAAGIVIALVIVAAAVLVLLPILQDGSLQTINGKVTPVPTTIPTLVATPSLHATSIAPTPTPEPFPNALALKTKLPFGSGKVASEATVYQYWINSSYQWHNDLDNKYYTQTPKPGNKYLFVFVQMMNIGDTRVWLPPASSVVVHYNGAIYKQDQSHYTPDKTGNIKATAIEVQEVQYFHKLNGDEYVEDFGFSHAGELGYIYPGKSNAVDGYIIYEVPESLTPAETYVAISFNGQDNGVWKLA
jgi:hypothetical protein